MTLSPGTRLGSYEIVEAIGAGGMGEVYKARDTRLDRLVAIKILASDLSTSAEAAQRFEREARTISQLSHPHICALYDVGRENGLAFLVMELIDGEPLATRIARGPLPLDQVLRQGARIADALDSAHRHGIIHRDLKPGNVMTTRSGLKLLDFGLAKLIAPSAAAVSERQTMAGLDVTASGTTLGTLHYMSPEQVEGRPADPRSDIFALGALLVEMATGRKAFGGETPAAVATAILRDDPPAVTASPALDRLVRTCLAKDPDARWQSVRDVQLQLEAMAAGGAETVAGAAERGRVVRLAPWAVAALAVTAALAVMARRAAPAPPAPAALMRFAVPPPPGGAFWDSGENVPMAMAPDGSQLAFIGTDAAGVQRVWLRPLSAVDAQGVDGTEGASGVIWSPDSRSIAFFAGGKLKRIDLPGGAAVTLCEYQGSPGMSGTWGAGGEILFTTVGGDAILRVPASGGTPVVERKPDAATGELRATFPWYLPDGRRYLYSSRRAADAHVMLAEPGKPPRPLLAEATSAQFVEPDFLVFVRDGTLLAQRFDAERGAMVGAATSLAASVGYFYSTAAARFATAPGGTMAYHGYFDRERLVWIDRSGHEAGTVGAEGTYISMRIAPDGSRVLYSRAQPQLRTFDLFVSDFARGGEVRLTSDPTSEVNAVWVRDGRSVFFGMDRAGPPHIFKKDLTTGVEAQVVPPGGLQSPEDISPDGRTLAFSERTRGGNLDLWTMPVGGGPPSPLLQTRFGEAQLRFAPNGQFFAFASNESGRAEIYLSPYPATGGKTAVSTTGGVNPRWSPDGRELFFLTRGGQLMAVSVRTSPSIQLGVPRALFGVGGRRAWKDYDVSIDGTRFLAIVTDVLGDEQPLTVVTNWKAGAPR